IAIVRESTDFRPHGIDATLQLVQLVLSQRLGGEEVHGAGTRLAQEEVQDWQVVAESLAAGSRGHNDNIAPRFDVFESFSLVRVKPVDSAPGERRKQSGIDAGWELPIFAFTGGLMMDGAYG